MTDEPARSPAAIASAPAGLPATQPDAAPPAVFDANGFDPKDFEWRPVPRRPRADG